jgi:hypothetical protein
MGFPFLDLLDDDIAIGWLTKHFHLHGLRCPSYEPGVNTVTCQTGLPVLRLKDQRKSRL